MKKIFIPLIIVMSFLLCNFSVYSDELDITLSNLNAQVKADKGRFISDLSLSFGTPKVEIENLIYKAKMEPADVFMALKISRLIRRPLDFVVGQYHANRGKGWGVIAQRLGIKPGSPEFHALKDGAASELGRVKGRDKPKVPAQVQAPSIQEHGGSASLGHGKGHNK